MALLCLGVGAATFLIMSPPTDYIRREIIATVKAETGRDLTIGGGASFTIFPSLGLRLNEVALSAPPGMGGEPLLKAANFDVGVRLMPLSAPGDRRRSPGAERAGLLAARRR